MSLKKYFLNYQTVFLGITSLLAIVVFFSSASWASATQCHLITNPNQTPGGYASPVSYFTGDLLIRANCDRNEVSVTVGNNSPNTFIYQTSYRWTGSNWQSVTLEGQDKDGPWIKQTATKQFTSNQTPTYYVAYTCEYVGGQWKCGCTNQNCTTNQWQLQMMTPISVSQGGSSGGGDDSGGLDYDGEIPEAVRELCPGAKLLLESEIMYWDKQPDITTGGNFARASVRSGGSTRYWQVDVKKGVAQINFEKIYKPFQNSPLSCAVLEFDLYLSPNYNGRATTPQIKSRKGPISMVGGFGYKENSLQIINDANPSDVTHPELNQGFSAGHNQSSSNEPRLNPYTSNRYALGANYSANSKKLFGVSYFPKGGWEYETGKWYRVSLVVKVNDDRKANGRSQIWVDDVLKNDSGEKLMWHYEPSKTGGVTGFKVRHMYGGTPSKLIPTQDQYERYRNLRIWGIRQ